MANQNIGTPRFYIDHLQYIRTIGKGYPRESGNAEDIFNLNPSSFLGNRNANASATFWNFGVGFPGDDDNSGDAYDEALLIENVNHGKLNYLAILGHNLGSCMAEGENFNLKFRDNVEYTSQSDEQFSALNPVGVANFDAYNSPVLDGFSIATFDDYIFNGINMYFRVSAATQEIKIASVSLGAYYDMPHSSELSLTMSHEYDGIKKQETAGGSTLSYANYYKPPDWGDLQAWQLGGWDRKYSGRRVWDLTFNHLSDSDLEPYHYNIDNTSGHSNWNDDGNWFTNVIHYTNGGQLPFIFCPDPSISYNSTTWTVPEFAICRFDMKTFKREQVANGIYNIKVKIKESW